MEEPFSGSANARLELIQVPAEPSSERPERIEAPDVDPRVSFEAALEALRRAPGGPELIDQLVRSGKEF
jgi:hypothetical protein